MTMSPDEIFAVNQRENGRIGFEVVDHDGRSYWITDVSSDDRLRVVGEDGRAFWFNSGSRTATLIKSFKKGDR